VAESSSPDDQRRSVVTGSFGVMLPQRGQPVGRAPAARVRRIDDNDGQSGVGGHLHQPATETGRWDARDRTAEYAAAFPARWPAAGTFAAFGSGFGEIQVFNDNGPRAVLPRGGNKPGDRGADPAVPGARGEPGQVQADGERGTEDVPVRCDRGDGEVAGVHVDRDDRAGCQVAGGRRRPPRGLP
jgi:hypothetical protein